MSEGTHKVFRNVLGVLAIGGSVLGLVMLLPVLAIAGRLGFPLEYLVFCAFAVYVFGIWAGYTALSNHQGWQRTNSVFWLAQVPGVVTPKFSFLVSAAAGSWIYIRIEPTLGAGIIMYAGSGVQIAYKTSADVILVGANFLALALVFVLRFRLRTNSSTAKTE